jgi:hypothetical protein
VSAETRDRPGSGPPVVETRAGGAGYQVRLAWYRLRSNRAWQVIMNMDPPKSPPRLPGQAQQPTADPAANPWINAQATEPAGGPTSRNGASRNEPTTAESEPAAAKSTRWPTGRRDTAPWQGAEPVKLRTKFWYVLIRGLLVVVLAAALLTGVRSWIVTLRHNNDATSQQQTAAIPPAVSYPSAVAAGAATRFATAYLSWDSAHTDARAAQLKAAGWTGDPTLGWNGKGKQTVENATVAAIQATSGTDGAVTVVATVHSWTGSPTGSSPTGSSDAGNQTEGPGKQIALLIPVRVDQGVASVSATPSIVAVPAARAPQDPVLATTDNDLTGQTQQQIIAFFKAYAADSDVSTLTAPGSTVTGLGGAVTYSRLASWTVAEPAGDHAQAIASVVWSTPDGAQLTQTYRLTLQRTVAGDAARWQVYAIT